MLCTLIALATLSAPHAPVTFNITKLYTSHSVGGNEVPYTPKVGEKYRLTVEYDVSSKPLQFYYVVFDMAYQSVSFRIDDLTAGHKVYIAEFDLPLDDKIPFEAAIDPYDTANGGDPNKRNIPPKIPSYGGNPGGGLRATIKDGVANYPHLISVSSKKGSFSPVPPAAAVEYYDPVDVSGNQYTNYTLKAGHVNRMVVMMGQPDTDSWQKFVSGSCTISGPFGTKNVASRHIDGPYLFPVYFAEEKNFNGGGTVKFKQEFKIQIRNVRVNPDKLRQVTWAAMDNLMGLDVFKYLTQPESVIQSNDPVISNFVKTTLGANYKSKYSPYDATRKIFQAVLKKCVYYYPKEGQPDLRAQTAVELVQTGRGDCGSFSMLLVACYRNMGIPARCACCEWLGTDNGHCWCEMYFPACGFVISDGAVGNGACEDGSFAPFFGYQCNMNARFATMRGNTFKVGSVSTAWLQGPMWPPVIEGTAQLSSSEGHTFAEEVAGGFEGKERRMKAHLLVPKWDSSVMVRRGLRPRP